MSLNPMHKVPHKKNLSAATAPLATAVLAYILHSQADWLRARERSPRDAE